MLDPGGLLVHIVAHLLRIGPVAVGVRNRQPSGRPRPGIRLFAATNQRPRDLRPPKPAQHERGGRGGGVSHRMQISPGAPLETHTGHHPHRIATWGPGRRAAPAPHGDPSRGRRASCPARLRRAGKPGADFGCVFGGACGVANRIGALVLRASNPPPSQVDSRCGAIAVARGPSAASPAGPTPVPRADRGHAWHNRGRCWRGTPAPSSARWLDAWRTVRPKPRPTLPPSLTPSTRPRSKWITSRPPLLRSQRPR